MPFLILRLHKRWRAWLATYLFIALAWPASGALPWLVFESGERVAANAIVDGARTADDAADGASHAAADVPGSPTHPLDHRCAQCEVLKHLARCVVPDACEPVVAPPPGEPVAPVIALDPRHASFIATRPPIRGPPSLQV